MFKYKTCYVVYQTCQYIKLVTQSRKVQGRLLSKGLVLFLHHGGWFNMHFARWIQTIYWRTSLRRVEAKYFYRRIRSFRSVACPFRKDLPRICVFPSHLSVSELWFSEDVCVLTWQLFVIIFSSLGILLAMKDLIIWQEFTINMRKSWEFQ